LREAHRWCSHELGYRFRDPEYLQRALTHRSAGGRHNERLEFLGDAVLGFVIAESLHRALPDADEGHLSRLRASLVKRETLAKLAQELELGRRLQLGAGELKSGGFRRASILADALEALLGAIYLDGDIAAAREVIGRLYAERLRDLPPPEALKDPKTRLQELVQGRGLPVPVYRVEGTHGADHRQSFDVACEIEALAQRTVGHGTSRRRAEQAAAERMLDALTQAEGVDD
jgi:ribonuclease-3